MTNTGTETCYLFTSFRGDGRDGLYLALSDDGLAWESLTPAGVPFATAADLQDTVVRDPCLGLTSDGWFHLVWTGGKQPAIAYARSRDLRLWEGRRDIAVMAHEPQTRNAWAPELYWDEEKAEWLVLWSSTIKHLHPEIPTLKGWEGFNHRIYGATTRDFETWSPTRLFFDPGYTVIDAAILKGPDRYYLFFKDEQWEPHHQALRVAESESLHGPYGSVSRLLTPVKTEAPTAIRIGDYYYVYFDRYWNPKYYGALRTKDFRVWEDVTGILAFPEGHRHGSVLEIPATVAQRLKEKAL